MSSNLTFATTLEKIENDLMRLSNNASVLLSSNLPSSGPSTASSSRMRLHTRRVVFRFLIRGCGKVGMCSQSTRGLARLQNHPRFCHLYGCSDFRGVLARASSQIPGHPAPQRRVLFPKNIKNRQQTPNESIVHNFQEGKKLGQKSN